MLKKILSCLTVMAILLTVTACKGGENVNNSDTSNIESVVNSSTSSEKDDENVSSESHTHDYEDGICIFCNDELDGYLRYHPFNEIKITKNELNSIFKKKYTKPKNIIVMIGDGMGPNDIILSEKYSDDLYSFGLAFNDIPYNGFVTTDSLDGTTDSAASATALATGTKTKNGYVGINYLGADLKNVSEIARECGKKVGIVTNDPFLGATPMGFVAHANNRNNHLDLFKSALTFAPDVFVGVADSSFKNSMVPNLIKNYLKSESVYDLNFALNSDKNANKKFLGYYSEGSVSSLQMYTQIALDRLKNKNGFFLMIENTLADKAGHSNDINGKINAVPVLDKAVVTVLNFMKNNPDTLLIITSDHETGGVRLPSEGEAVTNALFSTSNHTSTDVKIFALGYGAEYFNGKTVDNTDVAKFVINAVKGTW